MIPQTFLFAINHVLGQHAWARARLGLHAGRRLCLRTRPLFADMNLAITADGLITAGEEQSTADLLVVLKPAAVPFMLRRHPDAMKNMELTGNAGLASDVQHLFQNLEWDAEEDLSRIVGDIAAHRLARAGGQFFAWQRDALERGAQNLAEYLTEEQPMLARRDDFDRFRLDIRTAEQRLEAIDARINALSARARAPAG